MIELAPPQGYCVGMQEGLFTPIFQGPNPPVLFLQVLLRRNVVRSTDGLMNPGSGHTTTGAQINGAGGLIVEENVLDVTDAYPLQFKACNSDQFFANQTPAGALVQAHNLGTSTYVNELANVEDTVLLAL